MTKKRSNILIPCVAALIVAGTTWIAFGGPTGKAAVPSLLQASYELEAKGKFNAALSQTKTALKSDPDEYVAQLRVGWLAYLAESYTDSISAYRAAVRMKPQAVEPRLGLMLPLMAERQHKEALAVAEELLKIDPQSYLARSRKAYTLYLMGRYAKAAAEYRAVLALYPSDVEMMSGLGWSLLKQGDRDEARTTFRRLLHIAPNHVIGKEGLALCR